MGNISSPGYPNAPYFPEDQHDDNIRCHWKLRPPSGSYVMLTLENFFLGRKEWDYRRLVNSYNLGQMPWEKFAFVICGFFTCPTSPLRLRIQPFLLALRRKGRCISVPLTVGRTSLGGGREGRLPPASEVFLIFFLDGKTSAPDVFSSCLFIPRAHFETILVMVSHYGYEIWRLSSKWSSHFWVKMNVFSTFFNNKSTTCGWNDTKCLFMCYFTYQVQQITIYLDFNLISNSW